MAKFGRKDKGGSPAISTASLPDIVFMLLFFFMVTTVMKQDDLKIDVTLPQATELKKLEKKSLVSYVYIGAPKKKFQKLWGTEPRIQLNDVFSKVEDIQDFITSEREAKDEAEIPFMFTSLKVDEETKMGVVSDVKQELRKAQALKINYSSRQRIK